MSRSKKWIFRGLALCLSLLLCEIVLAVAGLLSPRLAYHLSPPWKRVEIADAVLGRRMSPYYPGNDAWGFRNLGVPDRCEALAIGDSWTYGFATVPSKTWPRQLEELSGKSIYNMSCGGYGPCEYFVLFQKGLRLKPRTVLLGLYLGNDFRDTYIAAYVERRFPEYQTEDPATQKAIADREKQDPWQGYQSPEGAQAPSGLKSWLTEKSSLYAIGRGLNALISGKQYYSMLREDEPPQDQFAVAVKRPGAFGFDADPNFRTVLRNPESYQLNVDMQEPRIREGIRIAESILLKMQSHLKTQNSNLVVVILPTKHLVYRDLIKSGASAVPASFFEAIEKEERLSAHVSMICKNHDIEAIDTTPALRSCFAKGLRPFPESDDHHPNAVGYRAIAEAVLPLLK